MSRGVLSRERRTRRAVTGPSPRRPARRGAHFWARSVPPVTRVGGGSRPRRPRSVRPARACGWAWKCRHRWRPPTASHDGDQVLNQWNGPAPGSPHTSSLAMRYSASRHAHVAPFHTATKAHATCCLAHTLDSSLMPSRDVIEPPTPSLTAPPRSSDGRRWYSRCRPCSTSQTGRAATCGYCFATARRDAARR
jgi:hypothetical protein